MEVGVTAFRAQLRKWLDLVQSGEEVVVTERGKPIAKLTPVGEETHLEMLTRLGILTPARAPKSNKFGKPIRAKGSVSDLIIEMRRAPDER